MSLENAPKHIKLAVDLIQLLEENQMPKRTLECGAGVEEDAKNKLALPDRC